MNGLSVTFKSDVLDVAAQKFVSALDIAESDEIGQEVTRHGTSVTFTFPSDEPIQNVRAWGAGAIACELVCSFEVSYLD